MSEETERDGEHENDGAGNVWGAAVMSRLPANDADDERKCGGGQNYDPGINADAADPFLKVVPVSLEDKPLISEEGKRNREEIGEQAGQDISVGKKRSQEQREQCKAAIAKDCVTGAHGQVPDKSKRASGRLGWSSDDSASSHRDRR